MKLCVSSSPTRTMLEVWKDPSPPSKREPRERLRDLRALIHRKRFEALCASLKGLGL